VSECGIDAAENVPKPDTTDIWIWSIPLIGQGLRMAKRVPVSGAGNSKFFVC
jgi:hypothetical protein